MSKKNKKDKEANEVLASKEADKVEKTQLVPVETESVKIESDTKPVKPAVSLKVFLQIFGHKWDQTAGFKRYAIQQKLEPLTVVEWRNAFTEFMSRPTK